MGEIKILFHVHVKWNFIDKILFDFIIMHKPIMAFVSLVEMHVNGLQVVQKK